MITMLFYCSKLRSMPTGSFRNKIVFFMDILSHSSPSFRLFARNLGSLISRMVLTFLIAALLYRFGHIPWILPYTGDGHYTVELVQKNWSVLMHSCLTTLVQKVFYTLMHPWGWSAWDAISFSSAVAGAVAIQTLFAIRRHPLFLLLNIFSGSFLVFTGEVEYYAWVNLFLLLTFLAVDRFLQNRWNFWPAAVFFFSACLFHMLAIFYLPALFWVMIQYPRFKAKEFLFPFLSFVFISTAVVLLFPHEGPDLDLGRLVPLFRINRKGQLFTFFSLEHWELLAYFHWKGCFLQSFPLEIPLLILGFRRIQTPFQIYLLLASLAGIAWTTAWHPDLGRLDWDLFSQMFIPLHVLLGILLSDRFPFRSKYKA